MTEDKDDYGISKPVDESYIDVEKRRADVSHNKEKDDNLDRSPPPTEDVDMSHVFDVGSGSGASNDVDELIDENAIVEHDGRATTRTFYYPQEAPERVRKKFARMLRWQEGERDDSTPGGRRGQNLRADTRRWSDTFTSQLEMTPHQRRRVECIVEDLTMSHMAHYSAQEVILGTITIVANEDNRFVRDEQAFKELVEDVGSDMYTIKRIRGLVRQKSDLV